MPHLTSDFPQRLMTFFTRAVSAFLLVSIFFILQYMFDMDFKCSCRKEAHLNIVLFIILPPLVLVWFVNVTEPIHKRSFFLRWCSCSRNSPICYLFMFILDYISLGVLWITAVLFDGEWYLCLQTNLNPAHTGIPCRKNLTYKEEQIQTVYKTESLDYGLITISSFVLLWFIGGWIHFCLVRRKKCCERCWSKSKPCPYYRVLYEDLLEEEVRIRLKDGLLEIAKERAKAICEPHLQEVRTHELEKNGDGTASDTWWTISASDFHSTNSGPQEKLWRKIWTYLRNLWPYDFNEGYTRLS